MKIAVCDDNKNCNDKLRKMLMSYINRNNIQGCSMAGYASGYELLSGYYPGIFDIIFLDVDMPHFDGFAAAGKIREMDLDVDIIFVTYMKEEVQKGFNYNAKGYLYKDVAQAQIDEKMDRLISERLRKNTGAFYKIKLKHGGTMLLPLIRVLYFESEGHNISAVTEKETYVFIDSITNLANELADKGFIRISQSYLVNIKHVFNVTGGNVTIKKGKELSVGRSYKQSLNEAFAKAEAGKWNI